MRTISAADLFCGGGGTSTGLVNAAGRLGRAVDLLAVNHWEQAIATHKLNHPGVRHYRGDLEAIDPRKAVPSGRLDLLVASPECTSHSYSKGARPISEQSRATAWCPLKWCDQLNVRSFLIENVPAFRQWGPTTARGKAIESRKGETYRQWLDMFRALGYTVEARVLNAADYGGATTRRRLFVLGHKGARAIRWPEPTHAPAGNLLGRKQWRAAREIIDWSLVGESIFTRSRPLAPSTRRRILMGLERFGGPELRPYLTVLRNHMFAQSVDGPVPTVAASGQHIGLAQPLLVHVNHDAADPRRVHSVDEPLPTVTAKRGLGLVEPFLLPHRTFKNVTVDSVRDPLRTITTKMVPSLVEPVVHDGAGLEQRAKPFIVAMMGERPTQAPRVHDIDEPFPTVMSGGGGSRGLAEPFLMKYSRTGGARSVSQPVDTLTTKDRYGLVTADGLKIAEGLYLDIRFRMLRPHELAAAMGFPAGYQFAGGIDDQVRQIGNAVEVNQAEALCFALLA